MVVKNVTFESARLHYRRTRFDAVRAVVKRPLLFSAATITFGGMPFLLPALIAGQTLSLLFEGIKYALGRKQIGGDMVLLFHLMEEVGKLDASSLAGELLKSAGRGEKILARKILSRLRDADPCKYDLVAYKLETSYKGRKLLGLPFKLMLPRLAQPLRTLAICAGLAAIPVADQIVKLSPNLFPLPYSLNTDISSPQTHLTILGAVLAATGLAGGRRHQQIGLGLLLTGASNLLDKLRLGGVIDYIHVGSWWNDFNMVDISMTAGTLLLLWGIIRDR